MGKKYKKLNCYGYNPYDINHINEYDFFLSNIALNGKLVIGMQYKNKNYLNKKYFTSNLK